MYEAVRHSHGDFGYPIEATCALLHISRTAYYKWLHEEYGKRTHENKQIAAFIETIHKDHPDKGYRRIRDDLDRYYGVAVNDKRVLRICRILQIMVVRGKPPIHSTLQRTYLTETLRQKNQTRNG